MSSKQASFLMSVKPEKTESDKLWVIQEGEKSLVFYINPELHKSTPLETLALTIEKFASDELKR